MSGFVIAVDGPAASGKGTIAAGLGRAFGLPVLDTGLLYRAVGLATRRAGDDVDDPAAAERHARALDPAVITASSRGLMPFSWMASTMACASSGQFP